MSNLRHLLRDNLCDVISRYQSGQSLQQIAAVYKVNDEAVRKILNRNNILRRPRDYWLANNPRFPLRFHLEEVINLYRSGLSCHQIAKIYGTSAWNVDRILHRHGITIRTKERPLSNNTEAVIMAYQSGLSLSQVGIKYGVTGSGVRTFLRRRGIERRPPHSFRRHTVNHDTFDHIDTPQKAYWLGFLFGDGTTSHRRGFLAAAPPKDKAHLEKLKAFVGSDASIRNYSSLHSIHLSVSSTKLAERLKELGLNADNHQSMGLPDIPSQLLRFFILGFFDAEGSIHGVRTDIGKFVVQIEFSQRSERILQQIADHINTALGVYHRVYHRQSGNHRLCYTGRRAKTVLNYLYAGCQEFALARKYQKYLQSINSPGCYINV